MAKKQTRPQGAADFQGDDLVVNLCTKWVLGRPQSSAKGAGCVRLSETRSPPLVFITPHYTASHRLLGSKTHPKDRVVAQLDTVYRTPAGRARSSRPSFLIKAALSDRLGLL